MIPLYNKVDLLKNYLLAAAAAYPYLELSLPKALKKLFIKSFLGNLKFLGNPSKNPLQIPIELAIFNKFYLPYKRPQL